MLQSHVAFWDIDGGGVIWLLDGCVSGVLAPGFRLLHLDHVVPHSIVFLLFNPAGAVVGSGFLSRVYVNWIQKAKQGSDTGIYDIDGASCEVRFQMFAR